MLPFVATGNTPVYHLFVIQTEQRDDLQNFLKAEGIGTGIHYPQPVHLQPAYQHLGFGGGSLQVTETAAGMILSLPMYPDLAPQDVETVSNRIAAFFS